MKMMLGITALLLALVLPYTAIADEAPVPADQALTDQAVTDEVPTDQEVMQAEGMPPVMPHAAPPLKGKSEEAACLSCHEEGKNGASPTPHAERRACTQCHVQGDIKPPAKKKGKK